MSSNDGMSPTQHRGRVGNLTRKYGKDHPAVIEARAELTVAVISGIIRKQLSEAPPLSESQKARLRAVIDGESSLSEAAP